MRKLYISVPMKGRTEKEIKESYKKMKKVAEAIYGEKFELIDTFVKNVQIPENVKDKRIWMLGESIKKMAEADVYAGFDPWAYDYPGCKAEHVISLNYDIEQLILPDYIAARIIPDLNNAEEIMPEPITIDSTVLEEAAKKYLSEKENIEVDCARLPVS